MPVDVNGRWVSRATLADQKKALSTTGPAVMDPEPEPVTPAKPRRTRRSKAAAQAAIKEATGTAVVITDEPDIEVLEALEDIIEETDSE